MCRERQSSNSQNETPPESGHQTQIADGVTSIGDLLPRAALIVRAISDWATLEYEIDDLICDLGEVEVEIGACMTAQFPTVNALLNALIAIAQVRKVSSAAIGRLNKFREWANAIADRRNRVAHNPWHRSLSTRQLCRQQKTAKARLDHSYKPVTEAELTASVQDIEAADTQFRVVRDEILRALWPLS